MPGKIIPMGFTGSGHKPSRWPHPKHVAVVPKGMETSKTLRDVADRLGLEVVPDTTTAKKKLRKQGGDK